MKKDTNKYPKGWNRDRVEKVIAHYDAQSPDDAIAEAQAAWENSQMTMMAIPTSLVAKVQELISKQSGKKPGETKQGRRSRRVA
jgi:hypothetical protein